MKILLLSWRCIKNPAAGGSELYFHELAKRWVAEGHHVVWFSPAYTGSSSREILDGVHIIRDGGRATVYLLAFWNYITGKLGRDYDVVLDVENGIPFFSPLYIKTTPVVLHIHHVHKSVWFKEFRFPVSWIGHLLESYVMPFVYRKNSVVTLSESSAREILEEKLTHKKPFIVNPGIEFVKSKRFSKDRHPFILFLNRIKKYKGVETLLRSAKIIQEKRPDAEIGIAGSGEDLDRSKAYAVQQKLGNVHFFGRVSEEKKYELMQRAWVFVNSSFKEGWGIVNIEANYMGTPVVGSDVAGIQDSIVSGRTGLLFPCDDEKELAKCILRIVDNQVLRRKLEREATEWAKRFDWKIKANEYLSILKRAAHRRN